MINYYYECEEVYSFENYDEINKALQFDRIGEVQIDQSVKQITYKIYRGQAIRLSDLIFCIESDFIRIHLGQLLNLIQELLTKVQLMESLGVQHNYLDINRIWLQLKPESQYPCLIYQFLYYSIHFTGYQCPFYEKQNKSIQASIQIKYIIQTIIQNCFKSIQFKWTDKEVRKEVYKVILQPIIDLCMKQNSSLYEIIQLIQQIQKEYNYQDDRKNNLVQSLNIDDNINDYYGSKRDKLIPIISRDLQSIIQFAYQYGQLVLDSLFQYSIKQITKDLESYKKLNFDYLVLAQTEWKRFQECDQEIKKYIQDSNQILIQNAQNKYLMEFKFEITQDDLIQLDKDILSSILQRNIKYFNNTYWLYHNNPDIYHHIIVCISKNQIEEVQDKTDQLFMLKILQLIDELI